MKIKIYRYGALTAFLLAVLLLAADLWTPGRHHWFFEIGIMATWILSPIGMFLSGNAFMATSRKKDAVLFMLNLVCFFFFPGYMFFGTLLESIINSI